MDKLIDYAEDGNTLEKHDDVPEPIRDRIYKHKRGRNHAQETEAKGV